MKEKKDMESKLKKQGSSDIEKDQAIKPTETDRVKKPTDKDQARKTTDLDQAKKPTDLDQAKKLIDEVLVQNTGMNAFKFSAETNDAEEVDLTDGSANHVIKTVEVHETSWP